MTSKQKDINFNKLSKEYFKLKSKKERSSFLDNLCKVYPDYSKQARKAFVRNLNYARKASYRKKHQVSKTRGRPSKYPSELIAALAYLLEQYNYPGADRFYSSIPEAIRIQQRDHLWQYSTSTTELLRNMPLGSLKAYVGRIVSDKGLMRGDSTTRPNNMFRLIEIFCGDWQTKPMGYGQVDTVVHSGARLEGDMAYTVTFIDVKTYWVAHRSQLNKSERATLESIKEIKARLPFRLLGLHPDSGSEFINKFLYEWCREESIELTRSRPSKKNDNCYVEERNDSSVRRYIGYERYDCREAVAIMNELYGVLDDYLNFFQPTMKLIEKKKLANGRWQRKYDLARTPYQRVLEQDETTESMKKLLEKRYESLNPNKLLAKIKALTIKLQRTQRELGYHFKEQ